MTTEPERYVNYANHACGCQSRFDTEYWRSQVNRPCAEHAPLVERYEMGFAVAPAPSERDAFVKLIALADAMLVEERRERQERFDAEHPECGGLVGAAEAMDSASRSYVYWRCRLSDDLGLPRAMTALRPPITPIPSS